MTLKEFIKSIGDVPVSAIGAITAITGIDYSLFRLGQTMKEASVKFNIFEAATGLSAQELQKWQLAGERVGVSGDAVAASIEAIQKTMASIKWNPKLIEPFAFLHINPMGKNVFQVLREMQKNMGMMNRSDFTHFANQLGAGDELIRLLSENKLDQFMNHVQGMTPKMVGQFTALQEAVSGLEQSFKQIGMQFVSDIMPGLLKFIDAVSKELPEAMQSLKGILGGIAGLISSSLEMMKDLMAISKEFGNKPAMQVVQEQTENLAKSGKLNEWVESVFRKSLTGAALATMLPAGITALPAYSAAAGPANVTINLYGLFGKAEDMISAAVNEVERRIGIGTRVQINNNATKRQQ